MTTQESEWCACATAVKGGVEGGVEAAALLQRGQLGRLLLPLCPGQLLGLGLGLVLMEAMLPGSVHGMGPATKQVKSSATRVISICMTCDAGPGSFKLCRPIFTDSCQHPNQLQLHLLLLRGPGGP